MNEQAEVQMTSLNYTELAEYKRCELEVKEGLDLVKAGYLKIGSALQEIHDRGFYRADFSNFENYCQSRWKISRDRAYQLINASKVAKNVGFLPTRVGTPNPDLHPTSPVIPSSEKQARLLAGLPPEQQREVWNKAVENSNGAQPTGNQVKDAVQANKDAVQAILNRRRAVAEKEVETPVNMAPVPPALIVSSVPAIEYIKNPEKPQIQAVIPASVVKLSSVAVDALLDDNNTGVQEKATELPAPEILTPVSTLVPPDSIVQQVPIDLDSLLDDAKEEESTELDFFTPEVQLPEKESSMSLEGFYRKLDKLRWDLEGVPAEFDQVLAEFDEVLAELKDYGALGINSADLRVS